MMHFEIKCDDWSGLLFHQSDIFQKNSKILLPMNSTKIDPYDEVRNDVRRRISTRIGNLLERFYGESLTVYGEKQKYHKSKAIQEVLDIMENIHSRDESEECEGSPMKIQKNSDTLSTSLIFSDDMELPHKGRSLILSDDDKGIKEKSLGELDSEFGDFTGRLTSQESELNTSREMGVALKPEVENDPMNISIVEKIDEDSDDALIAQSAMLDDDLLIGKDKYGLQNSDPDSQV
jgi:hypothetical protein